MPIEPESHHSNPRQGPTRCEPCQGTGKTTALGRTGKPKHATCPHCTGTGKASTAPETPHD